MNFIPSFRLRSPNGPNAGKYVLSADYSIEWTDDIEKAKQFDTQHAASLVMGAIDMCCEVLQPEVVSATEEDCKELGRYLCKGMFQTDGMVELFAEKAVRRSSDAPLYTNLPKEILPEPPTTGYMSVWEWTGRVILAEKLKIA